MGILPLLVSTLDKLTYVEPSKIRPLVKFQELDGPDTVPAPKSISSSEGETFASSTQEKQHGMLK